MGHASIRAINPPARSIADHLIWDEYLLRACDRGDLGPILRFWKVHEPAVVVGYSGKIPSEVRVEACQKMGVPIVRRTSGGGTVLLDAGCLNYSLVLPISWHAALDTVSGTNQFIMRRHQAALAALTGEQVDLEGDTDLAIEGRKFSGNAQRRLKSAILFHGTFLCQIDPTLMEQLLPSPVRQPTYRKARKHLHFLRKLAMREIVIQQALQACWHCRGDQPVQISIDHSLMDEVKRRLLRQEITGESVMDCL